MTLALVECKRDYERGRHGAQFLPVTPAPGTIAPAETCRAASASKMRRQ